MDQSEAGKKGYAKTKHQLKAYRQRKSKDVRTEYENNPKYCPNCDEKFLSRNVTISFAINLVLHLIIIAVLCV